MSDMRVYEAARKLNMQAGELVKLLEAKGVHTSPISTIEESLFNQLLEEMVAPAPKPEAAAEPAPPLKLVSIKEKPETNTSEKSGTEEEKPRPPLALAPDLKIKDEPAAPAPLAEPAKLETGRKSTPEPVSAAATPAPEVKPSPAAAAVRAEGPGAWTYMLGLLALILALGMGYAAWSLNNQNARMETAITAMQGAMDRINLMEKTVDLQGKQIAHNEASLDDLAEKIGSSARMEAKSDLKASAAAVEEMSDTLPAGQSERVRDLARRMDEMASGM